VYSEYVDASGYYVSGALFNDLTSSVQVEMVGAWLNPQGRVIYVDTLPFIDGDPNAGTATYENTTSLQPNQLAAFAYRNSEESLAPVLGQAQNAFWEVSK
jgi:hypothetical protein